MKTPCCGIEGSLNLHAILICGWDCHKSVKQCRLPVPHAGGLGLAAVQIVKAAGGKAAGTAGNPQKRGYLRGLGVLTALNSRSTDFADVLAAGLGTGRPQVALNSLTSSGQHRAPPLWIKAASI